MSQKSSERPLSLTKEEANLLIDDCRVNLHCIGHELSDVAEGRSSITIAVAHRALRGFRIIKTAACLLEHSPVARLSCAAANALAAAVERNEILSTESVGILLLVVDRLEQMARGENARSPEDLIRALRARFTTQPGSLCQSPVDAQLRTHNDAHGRRSMPVRRKLRILLVEDDFTSRVMLQGLLRPYGNCDVAVNGREAVEAFKDAFSTASQYDLVCMDVRMPEMDGTEAVRQIRAIEEANGVLSTSGVRIFMTTAIGDLKTVNSSYGSLCDAYLLKPIDGAQLKQHLADFRLLNAHARRRESARR